MARALRQAWGGVWVGERAPAETELSSGAGAGRLLAVKGGQPGAAAPAARTLLWAPAAPAQHPAPAGGGSCKLLRWLLRLRVRGGDSFKYICAGAVEVSCKTSLGDGGYWYLSRGETFWVNGLPEPEGITAFPLS